MIRYWIQNLAKGSTQVRETRVYKGSLGRSSQRCAPGGVNGGEGP